MLGVFWRLDLAALPVLRSRSDPMFLIIGHLGRGEPYLRIVQVLPLTPPRGRS